MKASWMWALPAFLVASLCMPVMADDEGTTDTKKSDKCFLWKVKSDTTTVYLLGSIHVGTKDMYPLDKSIEEAFKASKRVAVELDVTKVDQMKVQQMVLAKGVYQDGTTIKDHVSKKTYEKIEAACKKVGLPLMNVAAFKPGLLSQTLSQMAIMKTGYDMNAGIDKHFIERAHKDGKTVVPLETIELQLGILMGGEDDVQELFLNSTLDNMDNMKKDLAEMFKTWENGDHAKLAEIGERDIKKFPKMQPMWDKLNKNRNKEMVKKIKAYLEDKVPTIVIVGSLHMVGKEGLVKLLRDMKYTVEQVSKSK